MPTPGLWEVWHTVFPSGGACPHFPASGYAGFVSGGCRSGARGSFRKAHPSVRNQPAWFVPVRAGCPHTTFPYSWRHGACADDSPGQPEPGIHVYQVGCPPRPGRALRVAGGHGGVPVGHPEAAGPPALTRCPPWHCLFVTCTSDTCTICCELGRLHCLSFKMGAKHFRNLSIKCATRG